MRSKVAADEDVASAADELGRRQFHQRAGQLGTRIDLTSIASALDELSDDAAE